MRETDRSLWASGRVDGCVEDGRLLLGVRWRVSRRTRLSKGLAQLLDDLSVNLIEREAR
jgi:hypothetical protein